MFPNQYSPLHILRHTIYKFIKPKNHFKTFSSECYVKRRKDIIGRIKIDGTDNNIDVEDSTDLRLIICSD